MKKIILGIVIGIIMSFFFLVFHEENPAEDNQPVEEPIKRKTYEERVKEYYAETPYAKFYDIENIMNNIFCDDHKPQPSDYVYRETIRLDFNGESYIYIFFREKEYRDFQNERTFHAFDKTYGVAEYKLVKEEYELTTLTMDIGEIPTNNRFPGCETTEIAPEVMAFQFEISDLCMGTYVTIITLVSKINENFAVVFQETITTYEDKRPLDENSKCSSVEYEFWISRESITNGYYDLFLKLQGVDYEEEDLEEIEVDKLIKYSFDGYCYQVNDSLNVIPD